MKRLIILSSIIFLFASFTVEAGKRHYVSSYFYTHLSPYGTWIEIDYGVVVWKPTIMRVGWAPYRTGRWIWTYDGWYWDSYESFGYITYHYGRWFYDDYYGWLWYPDYEWAPAWVEWRYDNMHIGWAPLHPYASFRIGVGIFFTTTYYTPYQHWHFVTYNHFCDPYVYNYYVPSQHKYRVHSGTKYRTNYTYNNGRVQNRGVDVNQVRVRSGQEIREREIVRVRDSKELNLNGSNSRDQVRSLVVPREQLTRTEDRSLDIKQDRRKTSVDLSKVQIGERDRSTTSSRDSKTVERTTQRTDVNKVQKDDSRKVDIRQNPDKRNETIKRNTPVQQQGRVITNDQNRKQTNDKNVGRTAPTITQPRSSVDKRKETVTNKTPQINKSSNTVRQTTQAPRTEVKKENSSQNTQRGNTNIRSAPDRSSQQKSVTTSRDRSKDNNRKESTTSRNRK
jgi:hypothetical protein